MNKAVRKPSFSVATLTVCVLAVFGYLILCLTPWLPQPKANRLQSETAEFLRQGVHELIDWRVLDDEPFAEARRLDRPILLLIGAAWSREAREMDLHVFSDSDIQNFLQRNFVCIRVDVDASPRWASVYLPLSRVNLGTSLGFQLVYLKPDGTLYDFLGRRGSVDVQDPAGFLDEFVAARKAYGAKSEPTAPVSTQQQLEVDLLQKSDNVVPNRAGYVEYLKSKVDPVTGSFQGPGRSLRSSAIQMLLSVGEMGAADQALLPMLHSGVVDWLDGGFFRRSRRTDWTEVEFDKLAVQNGDMMRTTALKGTLSTDRFCERIAKNTFDALADQFCEYGLVSTARLGDETDTGRSARASYTAKDLRVFGGTGLLSSDEVVRAREMFHLRVEENPQMNIRVSDPLVFDDPVFSVILEKLRHHKEPVKVQYTRPALASVNGHVVATMLWCARLWNDPERLAKADHLFQQIGIFESGGDVTHNTIQVVGEPPYLGDYLAMADADLAHFLATGNEESLERGIRVMQRARKLFASDDLWLSTRPSSTTQGIVAPAVPEFVDGISEAQCAGAIRLTQAYGQLLRGGKWANEAGQFGESAFRLSQAFGSTAEELGLSVASYYLATLSVFDDTYAVAVGPDAVASANQLALRLPTRLVAPAVGLVRQDLQRRPAGIYVVRSKDVLGPLSVAEAAKEMGPVLDPQANPFAKTP